jgi:hypothetical protein
MTLQYKLKSEFIIACNCKYVTDYYLLLLLLLLNNIILFLGKLIS